MPIIEDREEPLQSLKKHLPKKTHCQRIENRVAEGMPMIYVHRWRTSMGELKIIKRNDNPTTVPNCWHLSHSRCGGVSFFLSAAFEPDVFLFESGKAQTKVQRPMTCGPCPSGGATKSAPDAFGLRLRTMVCGLRSADDVVGFATAHPNGCAVCLVFRVANCFD